MVTPNLLPISVVITDVQSLDDARANVQFDESPEFDFTTREFVMFGGNFHMLTGIDNLKQWIKKTLDTERSIFPIYSFEYGSDIPAIIGREISIDLLISIIPLLVKNALLVDNRIVSIDTFEVEQVSDRVEASFILHLFDESNFRVNNTWAVI